MTHSDEVSEIEGLIDAYWGLAFIEGREGRSTDTPEGSAQETRSAISRRLLALSRRSASNTAGGGVKVKPLEWEQGEAACSYGIYSVHNPTPLAWSVRLNGTVIPGAGRLPNEHAALSFAGSDHERRVLSAIEPIQAGGDEPVAWQHKLTSIIRYDRPNSYDLAQGDYAPLYTRPATPVSAEVTDPDQVMVPKSFVHTMRMIAVVEQGAGGNLTFEEMAKSAMRQASATLATLDRGRG